MSNKLNRKPVMVNSPSWREGGRNVLGFLIVFVMMFIVFAATLLMAV